MKDVVTQPQNNGSVKDIKTIRSLLRWGDFSTMKQVQQGQRPRGGQQQL